MGSSRGYGQTVPIIAIRWTSHYAEYRRTSLRQLATSGGAPAHAVQLRRNGDNEAMGVGSRRYKTSSNNHLSTRDMKNVIRVSVTIAGAEDPRRPVLALLRRNASHVAIARSGPLSPYGND